MPVLTTICAVLLCVAVAAAYRHAPDNAFLFDDTPNILRTDAIHLDALTWEGLVNAGRGAFVKSRPMPAMTFAFDWWRSGGRPDVFIKTNVFIHVLNTLLIFAVLRMLLTGDGRRDRGVVLAAAAGAAIWALHPIQVQAVTYIVQRMTELAALFSLVSVAAYVRARRSWGRPVAVVWLLAAVIAFAAAALSKENAWITPLLWMLSEYTVLRPDGRLIRSRGDVLVLTATVAVVGLAILLTVLRAGPFFGSIAAGYENRPFGMDERLLTQPRVILFHIGQMMWPDPDRFSLLHDFPLSRSLLDPPSTAVALAVVSVWVFLGFALALRPGYRTAAFFMLWIPATLAIESSFVPLELIFEHRMYLPSLGVAGLVSLGLADSGRFVSAPIAAAAVIGALVLLSLATQQRIPVWQSEWRVYEHAAKLYPMYPRAHYYHGNALIDVGRYADAVEAFSRVIELDPGHATTYNIRGRALAEIGRLPEAVQDFQTALKLQPEYPDALSNLGAALAELGDIDAARRYLERALMIDPDHAPARNNLMALQRAAGSHHEQTTE